jgi:hypothetical protein
MNHDALITVACAGLGAALSMALVCKDWRDAIHMAEGAVFDARSVLLKLGDTALISELNEALVLTNRTLSLYPHQTKRRHGGGAYKIFQHATAVSIFHAHGGAEKLEERQALRLKRRRSAKLK